MQTAPYGEELYTIDELSREGMNPVQISSKTGLPFSVVIDHLNGRDVVVKRRV